MHLWLAKGISFAYLIFVWFGLIDGVTLWLARRRSVPIGWAALAGLPLALSFEAIRQLFFPAACLGALGYHLTRRHLKHQNDPDTILLFFCSIGSTAASGAAAGLTIALFLFAAGLLDQWELWGPAQMIHLLWGSAGGGALLGVLRKAIRSRWPEPLLGGNPARTTPGIATARGAAIAAPFGAGGFWVDEIILSALCTPILWGVLSSIHPMWHLIFLYGWVFLPALVIYMFWAAIHTAWLRWAGRISAKDRHLYTAFEVLMTDDHVQRWLGELSIDYEPAAHRFTVGGALPRSHLLSTIRTAPIRHRRRRRRSLSGPHRSRSLAQRPFGTGAFQAKAGVNRLRSAAVSLDEEWGER